VGPFASGLPLAEESVFLFFPGGHGESSVDHTAAFPADGELQVPRTVRLRDFWEFAATPFFFLPVEVVTSRGSFVGLEGQVGRRGFCTLSSAWS